MNSIRFFASAVCNHNRQDECPKYKRVGKWCHYGIPDRPCTNKDLRVEAFRRALFREEKGLCVA